MFKKSLLELKKADDNKLPLLFCFIIPNSYFKYIPLTTLLLDNYLTYNIILKKKEFLYTRLSRDFTIINTTPIVDTCIIICNTKYIDCLVQKNISIFNEIINNWIIDNKNT